MSFFLSVSFWALIKLILQKCLIIKCGELESLLLDNVSILLFQVIALLKKSHRVSQFGRPFCLFFYNLTPLCRAVIIHSVLDSQNFVNRFGIGCSTKLFETAAKKRMKKGMNYACSSAELSVFLLQLPGSRYWVMEHSQEQ